MGYKISSEDIDRIIYAEHYDPFSVLGYHANSTGDKALIRAFIPKAKEISVVLDDGKAIEMEKIHEDGLFQCEVKPLKKVSYVFKITNYEGYSWEQKDPYIYPMVFTDFELHLFSEGNFYDSYMRLGAHPM